MRHLFSLWKKHVCRLCRLQSVWKTRLSRRHLVKRERARARLCLVRGVTGEPAATTASYVEGRTSLLASRLSSCHRRLPSRSFVRRTVNLSGKQRRPYITLHPTRRFLINAGAMHHGRGVRLRILPSKCIFLFFFSSFFLYL